MSEMYLVVYVMGGGFCLMADGLKQFNWAIRLRWPNCKLESTKPNPRLAEEIFKESVMLCQIMNIRPTQKTPKPFHFAGTCLVFANKYLEDWTQGSLGVFSIFFSLPIEERWDSSIRWSILAKPKTSVQWYTIYPCLTFSNWPTVPETVCFLQKSVDKQAVHGCASCMPGVVYVWVCMVIFHEMQLSMLHFQKKLCRLRFTFTPPGGAKNRGWLLQCGEETETGPLLSTTTTSLRSSTDGAKVPIESFSPLKLLTVKTCHNIHSQHGGMTHHSSPKGNVCAVFSFWRRKFQPQVPPR